MINYKQLLVFITVVEKKSFSEAAKKLYMTQPAVSWQVKMLENEIDLILIEKKERGVKLTEAGKYFYTYAKKIINSNYQLMEEMKQIKHMEKGKILIGANIVLSEYILPKYIQKFKEKNSLSDIFIKSYISEVIFDKILSKELQLGIIESKIDDNRIINIPLSFKKDKIILLANKNHPLINIKNITIEELLKYPLVIQEKGSYFRKIIDVFFEKNNINLRKFPYYIEISGCMTGITIIKNSNNALLWESSLIANDSLALKEIIELPNNFLKITKNLYLIYLKTNMLSTLNKKLIDFFINKKNII